MFEYRSPSKADYRSHRHHHRFSSHPAAATSSSGSSSSRQPSASANTSPMPAESSSAAALTQHFQARSFSLSTPSPGARVESAFQPRVLDDVFSSSTEGTSSTSYGGGLFEPQDGSQKTPSSPAAARPSWLAGSTPHQRSFSRQQQQTSPSHAPPTISTSFLHTPLNGQPLFSPFDPFAPSSSAAGSSKSPAGESPEATTPSTAYIESLTRAHRGSFLRSLSTGSTTSTSSSFSAGEPNPPHHLLDFPTPAADDLVSPSGESFVDYYFGDDDDGADDDNEEMMTESDTTESDARTSQMLSPTRSERSSYAEQLREHTLSMMQLIAPSAQPVPSPVKMTAKSTHHRRESVASDGSLSGIGMRRSQGARDNVFRNVAIYQPQED